MKIKKIVLGILIFIMFLSIVDNKKEISNKYNLDYKIKMCFVNELKKNKKYNWSRYDSDIWVDSYKIIGIKRIDNNTFNANAEISMINRLGENIKKNEELIISIK